MRASFFVFLLYFLCSAATADTNVGISDNYVSLSDLILGVEVKVDQNGQLLSAKSSYSHPVEFPDRRGINKAYVIAEEKAKAQFVRFMSQEVATVRVISEINQSAETARRSQGATGASWSKANVRNVEETLTEVSTSVAHGRLQGVRLLAREYNPDLEEVTVVIGINRQSHDVAGQLSGDISSEGVAEGSSEYPDQKAERQVSSDFEEF